MNKIENAKIKEVCYEEVLPNGLRVMIIPKKGIEKKYIIWATRFGSIDNTFIDSTTGEKVVIPDGVAHFLEHKMFEQKNGVDSLYVLMALGLDANAYTTNDHTAYLFECTDNFYEGLDELMDYVQNPYFTDQNVEKEKGIIGQEIKMYDDYPEWKVYLNALGAMYHSNPVKLDITGTVETISHIDKQILYKCYNTFYNPSNMTMVLCGDFEPENILKEVKSRLINTTDNGEIQRIYPEEPETIVKEKVEQKMDVSQPLYTIGIKDVIPQEETKVKKHIAIEILLNIIMGKSSKLYKTLYDKAIIYGGVSLDYEFSKKYAHILITGQSKNPEEVYKMFKNTIKELKQNGVSQEDFESNKKMIYGSYVKEYNDVADIARMFLADYFKGINSFDYLEQIQAVNVEYLNQLLKDVFKEEKMILSIVKN